MHEYSIVQALLHQVDELARERDAIAVHRLYVRIGELSGVETDLLATAYDLFRENTLCATAALEIQPVAVRWECPRCRRCPERGEALKCPDCALPARLTQGDEIILDRVEMEVN